MRFASIVKAASATLIAVASLAAHADQLADIKKKGEIVIGVLGIDEPNNFIDPKTREFIGYEIDLAKAIAAKIGVKPVFKQIAVAARIPELQQGGVGPAGRFTDPQQGTRSSGGLFADHRGHRPEGPGQGPPVASRTCPSWPARRC